MKIEQLIVQFLHKNKKVKLQSIGEFSFLSDSSVNEDEENNFIFPENSIRFDFDPKCPPDDDLINYIMSQTGKIKPLAASDLDSYIVLSKQFLNIGKTLFLNGLGALHKNQKNEYEFLQGEAVAIKLDIHSSSKSDHNPSDPIISFASPIQKKSNIRFWLLVAMGLIPVFIAFIIFYIRTKENNNQNNIDTPILDSIAYRDSLNPLLNSEKNSNQITSPKTNNLTDTLNTNIADTTDSIRHLGPKQLLDSVVSSHP